MYAEQVVAAGNGKGQPDQGHQDKRAESELALTLRQLRNHVFSCPLLASSRDTAADLIEKRVSPSAGRIWLSSIDEMLAKQ